MCGRCRFRPTGAARRSTNHPDRTSWPNYIQRWVVRNGYQPPYKKADHFSFPPSSPVAFVQLQYSTTIQYTNAKYKRGNEICCLQTLLSTKVWLKYTKLFPYWFWSSLLKNCRMLEKIQFYFRSLLVSGVGFTLSTSEISTLLPNDTAAHQDHCGRYVLDSNSGTSAQNSIVLPLYGRKYCFWMR